MNDILKGALFGLILLAAWFLGSAIANAHQAPSGWNYDYSCCNTYDCREVADGTIRPVKGGYQTPTDFIPYGSPKIRDSKDGHYHWCTVRGEDDTATICIYRPPNLF